MAFYFLIEGNYVVVIAVMGVGRSGQNCPVVPQSVDDSFGHSIGSEAAVENTLNSSGHTP